MNLLYLDCGMGAAGDMLTAALLELHPDPADAVRRLNALGLPGVEYRADRAEKCGIVGTHMTVTVQGETEEAHVHHDPAAHGHAHRHLSHIRDLVEACEAIPAEVKKDVLAVYGLLAEAESKVHGVPVPEIHFHEVGSMDALADVTAVCFLLRELRPDRIVASPIHVGCGQVRCAHGILPVPAPATAELLRGLPIYGGELRGELCTPTGAALLRYFVNDFGGLPVLRVAAFGYGMGTKDFPAANCVRAVLGTAEDATDTVLELSCNVDDMTAEALAFAAEELRAGGALEVYTVPIGMKKGRPGTLLRALCRPDDRDALLRLLFRHTTTLGVRETATRRYVLDRRVETVQTPWGPVRRKVAEGYGVTREKYEYEDLAALARAEDLDLQTAREKITNYEL